MQLILSQKVQLAQIWMRQDTRCSEGKGVCLVEQQIFNARSQHMSHRVKNHLTIGKKNMGAKAFPCAFILRAVLNRTANLMNSICI